MSDIKFSYALPHSRPASLAPPHSSAVLNFRLTGQSASLKARIRVTPGHWRPPSITIAPGEAYRIPSEAHPLISLSSADRHRVLMRTMRMQIGALLTRASD